MNKEKLLNYAIVVVLVLAAFWAGQSIGYDRGYNAGYHCGVYDSGDYIVEEVSDLTFDTVDLAAWWEEEAGERPDFCREDRVG